MNRDLSVECLSQELRDKPGISRRDSLALTEVTRLRARAGGWNEEYAQGWTDGLAEGHAIAVLTILRGRGVIVTGDIWERVSNCSDLRVLTRWLNRSYSVTRAQDLFSTDPVSPRVPSR